MQVDVLTNAAPLRTMQNLARDAERAGFSGLVVTEAGRTAYLSCAAAALAADLHLATGVAVAFARSPMVTASSAWELADLTGGRFRLGLGTQVRAHVVRRYASSFDPPGPRLREYVEAVRAIFRAFAGTERLDFQGRYWQFSLLPREWSPGPLEVPAPPIDVAAVNPWMLRMAGEVADGVHIHPLNTPTYLATTVRPALADGAARAGRDADDLELLVPCFTVMGDTEEERAPWREAARWQIAFYGSTPNYAFVFDQIGAEGTTARLRAHQKAGDLAAMAGVVSDEVLSHFVVEGTWDELSDRLVARFEGVASRIVLYSAGAAWRQDPLLLDRLGEVARDVVVRTT
ncbi:MAG: TIGR03617 family F420-dependent LLM class oxidoreductase [Acidimicrobiales bacterium]|jgi:probable F420-dependent oxidoreductase|nr:TIGR03617 family F420-dependent LLM class oxidoreductase [Acidimicrobiales bacterium]